MNDVPFHLTVMGRRFYEAQLPKLIAAIERIGDQLERIASAGSAVVPPNAPPVVASPVSAAKPEARS